MSFALVTLFCYGSYSTVPAGSDDFELLDGTDFLLLDGSNFLLLVPA